MTLPNIKSIRSILIVKTSSIGDVVHALPIAQQLKAENPAVKIGWVVREKSAAILRGNPNIDHLYVLPDRPKLRDLFRFSRAARRENYACAMDLQGLFLSGLITFISGTKVRIGLDRNREANALFMTHPVVPGKSGEGPDARHAVNILFGFTEVLGAGKAPSDFPPQHYLTRNGFPYATADERSRRIGLNVGASSKFKQWPVSHWATLTQLLLDEGLSPVFMGDAHDAEIVGLILREPNLSSHPRIDAVANSASRTKLSDVPRLLTSCAVVITGDTGPMHMAVAVGTPAIALFGSTNPKKTGPYGTRNTVLDMYLDCAPCFRHPTCHGRVDCMRAILPHVVLDTVRQILMKNGS